VQRFRRSNGDEIVPGAAQESAETGVGRRRRLQPADLGGTEAALYCQGVRGHRLQGLTAEVLDIL